MSKVKKNVAMQQNMADTKKDKKNTKKEINKNLKLADKKKFDNLEKIAEINPALAHSLKDLFRSGRSQKTLQKYQYLANQYVILHKDKINMISEFREKNKLLILENSKLKINLNKHASDYSVAKSLLEDKWADKINSLKLKYVKYGASVITEILVLLKHISKNSILEKHFKKTAKKIAKKYDLEYYTPKKGARYDPEKHESVNMSSGLIIETITPGYIWNSEIIIKASVVTNSDI